MVAPTNSLAVVSLVMGVASSVILPFVGALIAIITGHQAQAQIRRTGEGGTGMALAGLILGYVNLGLVCIGMVLVVILLNQTANSPGQGPFGQ